MNLALTNTAFWDTNLQTMDEQTHAPFIITRVFQYGLLEDIRTVLHFYTPLQITTAFKTQRGIDKKVIALAAVLLNVEEKELS